MSTPANMPAMAKILNNAVGEIISSIKPTPYIRNTRITSRKKHAKIPKKSSNVKKKLKIPTYGTISAVFACNTDTGRKLKTVSLPIVDAKVDAKAESANKATSSGRQANMQGYRLRPRLRASLHARPPAAGPAPEKGKGRKSPFPLCDRVRDEIKDKCISHHPERMRIVPASLAISPGTTLHLYLYQQIVPITT